MRILIDECVNPRVRRAFPNHEVLTVVETQWRTLPDHDLVSLAQVGFDVLVTIDRGFEYEHNLRKLTIAIVIVHVQKNRMEHCLLRFPAMEAAVCAVRPGEVIHVRKQ